MFKYTVIVAIIIFAIVVPLFIPRTVNVPIREDPIAQQSLEQNVGEFLESKDSPLAPETKFLLAQKHWKLLIAISAIESQYCKRQLGNNCWGVGGDSAYRHYSSIRASIQDANDLIEHWQKQGRWLTVEDMNCHYVQPCNPTWVKVVNKVLEELNEKELEVLVSKRKEDG